MGGKEDLPLSWLVPFPYKALRTYKVCGSIQGRKGKMYVQGNRVHILNVDVL